MALNPLPAPKGDPIPYKSLAHSWVNLDTQYYDVDAATVAPKAWRRQQQTDKAPSDTQKANCNTDPESALALIGGNWQANGQHRVQTAHSLRFLFVLALLAQPAFHLSLDPRIGQFYVGIRDFQSNNQAASLQHEAAQYMNHLSVKVSFNGEDHLKMQAEQVNIRGKNVIAADRQIPCNLALVRAEANHKQAAYSNREDTFYHDVMDKYEKAWSFAHGAITQKNLETALGANGAQTKWPSSMAAFLERLVLVRVKMAAAQGDHLSDEVKASLDLGDASTFEAKVKNISALKRVLNMLAIFRKTPDTEHAFNAIKAVNGLDVKLGTIV